MNNPKWATRTSLANKSITNVDALLRLLANRVVRTGDIQTSLRVWRGNPKLRFVYLFSDHASRLEGCPRLAGEAWYRRVKKGTYELTEAGWRRVKALGA